MSQQDKQIIGGDGAKPGGDGDDRTPERAVTVSDPWREWLNSPRGQYVLSWEQAQFDRIVADLFGFIALQCGQRELDALRNNRMPCRSLVTRSDGVAHYRADQRQANVVIDSYEELPFASESVDLVVLPHVLEFAEDPHQVLREIDRVLRPEGRVIISGFNPVSLWGVGQFFARVAGQPFLPEQGHFIGLPRLRDWFKLLSFEFQRGRYGCYRPPVRSERWIDRTQFMEAAGDRWWPICGAVYCVSAVKRVRGIRAIGPVRRRRPARRAAVIATQANYEPANSPRRSEGNVLSTVISKET